MNTVLRIDSEYEAMCPPLTDEEYQQLEENILSEGLVLMPLIVWDGTIIDGHNRYKIAQEHPEIAYNTYEKQFENRFAAIAWICKNQLGRRNLSHIQKKILIGRQYESEKAIHGGERGTEHDASGMFTASRHSDDLRCQKTNERIAQENKVSSAYVDRAGRFVRGLDAAEEVLPGISREISTGKIKPSAKDVADVAKAPLAERRQKAEALRVNPDKGDARARASASKSKPAIAKRQELQEIRDIYTDMLPDDASAPTSEDSILETLHGAVTDMIRVCDTLFTDFPRLLEDRTYKARVIEIMQEPKNYILHIEGVRQ